MWRSASSQGREHLAICRCNLLEGARRSHWGGSHCRVCSRPAPSSPHGTGPLECLTPVQGGLLLHWKSSTEHSHVLGLQRAADCRTDPLHLGEVQTNQQLNHLHRVRLERRRLEKNPLLVPPRCGMRFLRPRRSVGPMHIWLSSQSWRCFRPCCLVRTGGAG